MKKLIMAICLGSLLNGNVWANSKNLNEGEGGESPVPVSENSDTSKEQVAFEQSIWHGESYLDGNVTSTEVYTQMAQRKESEKAGITWNSINGVSCGKFQDCTVINGISRDLAGVITFRESLNQFQLRSEMNSDNQDQMTIISEIKTSSDLNAFIGKLIAKGQGKATHFYTRQEYIKSKFTVNEEDGSIALSNYMAKIVSGENVGSKLSFSYLLNRETHHMNENIFEGGGFAPYDLNVKVDLESNPSKSPDAQVLTKTVCFKRLDSQTEACDGGHIRRYLVKKDVGVVCSVMTLLNENNIMERSWDTKYADRNCLKEELPDTN